MKTAKTTKADLLKSEAKVDEISKQELDTLKAEASRVADLEKSVAESLAAKEELDTLKAAMGDADITDLMKAVTELADIRKAAAEKVLTDTVEVVKGFNLFEEDSIEDVAKFFVANASDDSTKLILASLEKARTQIEEFGTQEHGHDLEGKTADVNKQDVSALSASVLDIIKSRKK